MNPDDENPYKPIDDDRLRVAYQAMSADKNRDAEANEWCEATVFEPVDSERYFSRRR